MSFRLECEMTRPALRWLTSQGLHVKTEFPLPWGICDLVGLAFDTAHVSVRQENRQRKAIGPLSRIAIFDQLPDVGAARLMSLNRLAKRHSLLPEGKLRQELDRLIADGFVRQTPRGTFCRVNGWLPLQRRIVAIELKLSRITEVFEQAKANLALADESYVGLPRATARRLVEGSESAPFREAGVGILGLALRSCKVLLPANADNAHADRLIQIHCAERFWRTRPTDSSA